MLNKIKRERKYIYTEKIKFVLEEVKRTMEFPFWEFLAWT